MERVNQIRASAPGDLLECSEGHIRQAEGVNEDQAQRLPTGQRLADTGNCLRGVGVAMKHGCGRLPWTAADSVLQCRAIATQEVIEELIKLAKEMSAATSRGVELGLNEDEVAFYDALAANESAVQAMGNDELKVIAAELVTKVRKSVTIDWTLRESARARIRVMVKRILKKHRYPPDLQDEATKTVLAQAELLSATWA